MIKSVLIKDASGKMLIKVSYHKGVYEVERLESLESIQVEVRDEKNRKVKMGRVEV